MEKIQIFLNKVDFRISHDLFSRPQYQVKLISRKLAKLIKGTPKVLLDIGGGHQPQYKYLLKRLAKKYINIEISSGPFVDIVGTAYDIPVHDSYADIAVLFMVMEHLNNPAKAIRECKRVLIKDGFLVLTTVQYWHTHNHPNDYFRYTRSGLEYLINKNGFKIIDIWSLGGPFLVIFHAIEINLIGIWRPMFSIVFYRIFDWLDWVVFKHADRRLYSDSVGWALIAQKL